MRRSERSLGRSTRSTVAVMVSTFASRLLGFVRIAVIGAIFGASGNADVLNLVFTIPNNLRKLTAEGALSSAFIPVLSQSIVDDAGGETSRGLVRSIATFQFVVLAPFMVLAVVFAQPVVDVILDFPELERQLLAADAFRWFIHYTVLISLSAVLMATLNSHRRFLIPALTPVLFSITVIASILLLHRRLGIFSMAVGVLAGGLIQILFQLPSFAALGYSLRPRWNFSDPRFRKVLRQWLPVVGTASIFTINQQVAILFASGLEDGSGSAMTNALVFWQLPFGIFGAAITTVLFPRMSRQAALNDRDGLSETLQFGFRYLVTLLVPSALVLSLLGREIIAVALQRGAFEARFTVLTSEVLMFYSLGLLSVGAYNFFQRFFYATDDFRTPLIVAVVTLILDVSLSLWLKETVLGVRGLALANSIAFSVGLLLLLYRSSIVLGGIDVRRILVTLGKVFTALVPIAAFIRVYLARTGPWWREGSTVRTLGLLAIPGISSIVICLGMYYILRVEAFSAFLRARRQS
ncbi:MAG: murein biosynthesis integral membrane protein MurJ [Spirochaetaceae bacterium]